MREKILYEREKVKKSTRVNFDLLIKILISGEDHRYYYHPGFDLIAVVRAVKNRIVYNRIEGASTIEQQLVRVLTDSFERTFRRKIEEILLAYVIKRWVSKDDIPKIYLSVGYYGYRMNGLTMALKVLGLDDKKKLDPLEAAAIIARLKYPEKGSADGFRKQQIAMRQQHLIRLYNKHSKAKYFNIYG